MIIPVATAEIAGAGQWSEHLGPPTPFHALRTFGPIRWHPEIDSNENQLGFRQIFVYIDI